MELGILEFKAEDFSEFTSIHNNQVNLASYANCIIKEKLEKAPVVEFSQGMFQGSLVRDFSTMVDWELLEDPKGKFTARLICIEAI